MSDFIVVGLTINESGALTFNDAFTYCLLLRRSHPPTKLIVPGWSSQLTHSYVF